MNMKKNTDLKGFWNGKGFYLALAVVIGGSALASYLAVNAMMNNLGTTQDPGSGITGQEDIIWQENTQQAENKQENVQKPSSSSSTVSSTPASSGASSSASSGQQEPQNWQPAQATSFTWPMQGPVLVKFSGDELVFNETMQDWRTHNGVDIGAPAGTAVKIPVSGEVVFAGEDAQWGGVVEVESGKMRVRLCGLKDIAVKQGASVKAGDQAGALAAIPAEGKTESHLHLEVLEDGKLADPTSYVA